MRLACSSRRPIAAMLTPILVAGLISSAARPVFAVAAIDFDQAYFSTSVLANSAVVGDVDENGTTDVVAGGSVFRGIGNGKLKAPSSIGVTWQLATALEDLDHDGHLDLVVTSDTAVLVLRGAGNGTFTLIHTLPIPGGLRDVKAGNLDADAELDLVVATATPSGMLSLFRGIGDGSFVALPSVVLGFSPGPLALGDLDHNGCGDVVVGQWGGGNSVRVLLAGPCGTFAPPVSLPTAAQIFDVLLADFDADSNLDLALAGGSAHTIFLYSGLGNGSFTRLPDCSTGFSSRINLCVADTDADGDVDLVGFGSQTLSVFPGHGDGHFDSEIGVPTSASDGGLPPFADHLVVTHLDANASPDLVVAGNLNLFTATGAHRFGTDVRTPLGGSCYALAVGLLDGDGELDAVAQSGQVVRVLHGEGDGRFTTLGTLPMYVWRLQLEDLNADGFLDLAACLPAEGVAIQFGNGDGSFDPPTYLAASEFSTVALAIADLNSDGSKDIVVLDQASVLRVLLGTPSGVFSEGFTCELAYPWGCDVKIADFNSDGKPDVAVRVGEMNVGTPSRLFVLPGLGDGTFGTATQLSVAFGAGYLATPDLNGDAIPDLAVSTYGSGVSVRLNQGDGTFTTPAQLVLFDANRFKVGDVDGDGNVDLIASGTGPALAVARGRGDGTFDAALRFPANGDVGAVADINHDGRLDAIVMTSSGIAVHFNRTQSVTDAGLEPRGFAVHARVNPAVHGEVGIEFNLARASDTVLRVLDVRGRQVDEVRHPRLAAGSHVLRWRGTGSTRIHAGVYFFEITAGTERGVQRVVVLPAHDR